MENVKTYRLATKTETGAIVQFGPRMSMPQAQRKQADLLKLTDFPVYIINTSAE